MFFSALGAAVVKSAQDTVVREQRLRALLAEGFRGHLVDDAVGLGKFAREVGGELLLHGKDALGRERPVVGLAPMTRTRSGPRRTLPLTT